jgi:hypothetical protein
MDEARAVLERLERIEALERAGSPAGELLDEVKALLVEAESWVRVEPHSERAAKALDRCADALADKGAVAIM